MQLRSLILLLAASLPLASAQFNFFDQMFGHSQQQQQRESGPSGNSQWMAHSEALPCSQYLCPSTLTCVNRPADCPCPNAEDIKCTIPDAVDTEAATVVCVRGVEECTSVERLMSSYFT
ncbi:uncharacterized protein BJ212DRAFT_1447239 [Suillus subaureus]|uniref:Long chronological lifespan protein 2 n=1 Tax=Suillus subaureus TaxID=48587 RepID=A0A9P7E9W1_9AGAM|nr:uncharacterized protein BJ212DRAFT_1447239 [Suillus subaureus]KAG1815609.1 hypothetical protein BJ212DRAFT_1447239 [Suillus subaureus]